MTAALTRLILIIVLNSVQLLLSAQPFPTQADHDREVDSLQRILSSAKDDTTKVNTLTILSESLLWWSDEDRPKAFTPIQDAIDLAKRLNYTVGLAKALDLKGTYYLNSYNKEEALKSFNEALKVKQQDNDKIGMVNSYLKISDIKAKNYAERMELYSNGLRLARETGDKKTIAGVCESMGLFSFEEAKYKQSLKYYTEYLKLAEELQNFEMLGVANNQLGLVNLQMGNYNEALSHYFAADKSRKYAVNSPAIASVYRSQGNYPEALKFHFSSLQKNIEKGDKQRIVLSQRTIGAIYLEETAGLLERGKAIDTIGKKIELARIYLLPALEFFQHSPNKLGLAASYQTLGKHHLLRSEYLALKTEKLDSIQKNLKLSESYYLQALKLFEELPDYFAKHYGKPSTHVDLGLFYQKQASIFQRYKIYKVEIQTALTKSSDNYYKAIKTYTDSNHIANLPSCYIYLGKVFTDMAVHSNDSTSQKKYDKGISYINKGLFMAKDIGLRRDVLKAYEALAEANKAMKDYETGLEYLELYESVRDSLINNESVVKTSELTAQHLADKKEMQEKIKQEKIRGEQERKKMLFILIGSVMVLSLGFGSLLLRQKSLKRKEIEKVNNNRRMAELELQSLRAQLNPHFMFNSLNAIQELILKEDNDNSHLYLSRFSDLLRMLLENANQPFISLRKELNLLELYLSLENLRIPDLKYSIDIDPLIDGNKITIPNMMLQPYIENAIWHGLSHKKENKNIYIRVSKKENGIVCEIEDNGVGRKMSAELKSLYRKEHRSKGMELLSKRFNLLSKEYGSEIQTTIEDLHDNDIATGTRVAIAVPYSLTDQPKPVYS